MVISLLTGIIFLSIGIKFGTFSFTPPLFIKIKENKLRNKHRVSAKMPDYGTRKINGKKVKHVVSLGTHCLASNILKSSGLKNYSLPFDWVFSTPEFVIDNINRNFELFLPNNYTDYKDYAKSNFNLDNVFVHKNPETPEYFAYYTRCISRFNDLLNCKDGKIFFLISRSDNHLSSHFTNLVEILSKKTKNFELIAVDLEKTCPSKSEIKLKQVNEINGSRLFKFTPNSDESKLGYFPDVVDDILLLRLIYNYHLDL